MPPPPTPPTSCAISWPQSTDPAAVAASAAAAGSIAAAAEQRPEDRAAGDAADHARDQLRQQRHAGRLDHVAGEPAADRAGDRLHDDRDDAFHPVPLSVSPDLRRAIDSNAYFRLRRQRAVTSSRRAPSPGVSDARILQPSGGLTTKREYADGSGASAHFPSTHAGPTGIGVCVTWPDPAGAVPTEAGPNRCIFPRTTPRCSTS